MKHIDPIPYRIPNDDQLCFLHIPKTAGNTFTYLMHSYYTPEEICPSHFWHEVVNFPIEDMARYRYVGGHIRHSIQQLLPKPPHYMAFLRDPVERVISHYDHARRVPESPFHHANSLEEFVKMDTAKSAVSNTQTVFLGIDRSTKNVPPPKLGSFKQLPVDDSVLEKAKARLDEFFFVGIVEHFQESLYLLAYMLGWRPFSSGKRRNISPNRLQRDDLSPELLQHIRDINLYDIELYDYAKQLYTQQLEQMQCTEGTPLEDCVEAAYRKAFMAHNTPTDSLIYDLRHALPGQGLYPAESTGDGYVRWTGPQTVTEIDLPLLTDKNLQVSIVVAGSMSDEILNSLTLHVGDHQIPLKQSFNPPLAPAVFKGTLPRAVLQQQPNGFVRLRLQVSHTVSPKELNKSQDVRKLGVSLKQIEIEPA